MRSLIRGLGLFRIILGGSGLALLVTGAVFWLRQSNPTALTTPYQAVFLSNGSAYYGHLEGLGTPFPVLKEVYYVESRENPETKQKANILVKRGKEWHAPDRMILNAKSIVLVEPVDPSSQMAQRIADAKNR
jgi:hypothetical protein